MGHLMAPARSGRKLTNVFDAVAHGYDFAPAPCEQPTDATPGSRRKLEVIARRAVAGEELWHPDDSISCDTEQSGARIGRPKTSEVLL